MTMIISYLFATNVITKSVIGIAINNLGLKIELHKKKKIFTVNFVFKMIRTFINVMRKTKK